MLFQCFRPYGEGVEAVFEGVVGGEEILARLHEVYAVTADGWQTEERTDYYFIVRRPQPLAAARAEELCRTWLANVLRICKPLGDEDYWLTAVRRYLNPMPPISVVQGTQPRRPGEDSAARRGCPSGFRGVVAEGLFPMGM